MPNKVFTIAGIVRDNNQNLITGAVVNLRNTGNGEELATDDRSTTNSAGEFSVNAANLTTDFTDGQGYEITITHSDYADKKYTGTLTAANGTDFINVYLELLGFKKVVSVRELVNHNIKGTVLSKFEQTFQVWANNKAATASATVVTANGEGRGKGVTKSGFPGVNLEEGETAFITSITCNVRTASKVCSFEVVKCSAVNGEGTAVSVSGEVHLVNGTIATTRPAPFVKKFDYPIKVKYDSSNALSVGVSLNGTDTSTMVDFIMEGFILGGVE